MKFSSLIHQTLIAGLLGMALHAADATSKAAISDPDLPTPFDATVANSLLENSPVTRSLNLSDALVLTGIAYIDGKPVATQVGALPKSRLKDWIEKSL